MNILRQTCLAALLAAAALPAAADRVAFEALPDAGAVRLTLDAGLTAVVRWADGTAEEVSFDGDLREIKLHSPAFSLETAGRIGYVVCPDNPLKAIDLSGAPYVKGVYAQNCRLEAFCPGVATSLEVLHLSGNAGLAGVLPTLSLPALRFLGAADCALERLPDAQALPGLHALWAWNNRLAAAPAAEAAGCEQVYLQNNRLTAFAPSAALTTLSVAGNALRLLNLQRCDSLVTLDASDNQLRILVTSPAAAATLRHFYVDGNSLTYADMPTLTDDAGGLRPQNVLLAPQKAVKLPAELAADAAVSLSAHIGANQWGKALSPEVVWTDAEAGVLVAGEDYLEKDDYGYVFLKNLTGVTATVSCAEYPGMTLATTPMRVSASTTTAVGAVGGGGAGVSVAVSGHVLTVSTAAPAEVTVCGADGVLLRSGLLRGTWSRHLPAGVYIVNNRKVMVGTGLSD